MNEKGFAATGILYTIFVLFILLVMGILTMLYSRNNLLNTIKNQAKNEIESTILCANMVGTVWSFDYSGDVQTFVTPCNGEYQVQLWGASGGGSMDVKTKVGAGAYTSGIIDLKSMTQLYLYVGQEGTTDIAPSSGYSGPIAGAYNGGGATGSHIYVSDGSGGGATDLRIVRSNVDDFNSLKSRIMVAAGGGGQAFWTNVGFMKAGSGGGLVGYEGQQGNLSQTAIVGSASGGTQISGGKNNIGGDSGSFGLGGIGSATGGGGGGYYGGAAGIDQGSSPSAGAGGSSFISGHSGCDAIAESSTNSNIIHTGQNVHYSGYVFKNTVMIDGNGYQWTNTKGSTVVGMPTYDGTDTMSGNLGNGYAKITLLSVR